MRCTIALAAVAAMIGTIAAADLKSGPQVGEKAPALPVFVTTGALEGKDVDFVEKRKGKPTVYLFVQSENWDRPMARFIKTIDKALADGKEKAEAVAVWITEKPDEAKEYLPKVQASLQLQATALAVSGEKGGPKGWGLNDLAHITVVVVHEGKVVATFAHKTVNETDAAAVKNAVKKAAGSK